MTTIIRRRGLGKSSAAGIAEKSKTGIQWVLSDQELPEDDVYIRWGCTANVPAKRIINTAKAIHEVNNKREFRRVLNPLGLCPLTFFAPDEVPNDELARGVVVRPEKHAQGRNIFLTRSREELRRLQNKFGKIYISHFVDKAEEYRVFVVQGRAVAVAKKTPGNPGDLAWNVARGGRFDNVRFGDWNLDVVDVAIKAFNASTLHFGGVDVMVGKDGACSVVEINSAPSLTSPYRQEKMAQGLDYLLTVSSDRIPVAGNKDNYRAYIHPGVCEEAFMPQEEAAPVAEPKVQPKPAPAAPKPVKVEVENKVADIIKMFRGLTGEQRIEAAQAIFKEQF